MRQCLATSVKQRLCRSLGNDGKKWFWDVPIPGFIPRRSLLFQPNYLQGAKIAQISLKSYFFPRLLAYFPLAS
jgi:hypothetical protein